MPIVSTVQVNVTFSNGITLANTFVRPPNENSPGVVEWISFPVGFTQLINPPGTIRGLIIIPPTDNVNPMSLVGDNNDDGVPISPNDPTFLALSGIPDVGLKIGIAPTLIRLIWV